MNSSGNEKWNPVDGIILCIGFIVIICWACKWLFSLDDINSASEPNTEVEYSVVETTCDAEIESTSNLEYVETYSDEDDSPEPAAEYGCCFGFTAECGLLDDSQSALVLTDEESEMLATLVYLEGRGESTECQKAICSVVINRYLTGQYDSLADVVYETGQFSTAKYIQYYTPTDAQRGVVDDILVNGCTLPRYIIYFRSGKYHKFTDAEDFISIDNTYFSGSKKLKSKLGDCNDSCNAE